MYSEGGNPQQAEDALPPHWRTLPRTFNNGDRVQVRGINRGSTSEGGGACRHLYETGVFGEHTRAGTPPQQSQLAIVHSLAPASTTPLLSN